MLDGEHLFSIPRAFEIETGVRISPATGHRYRLRDGLETVRLGGRRMTSREAVRRLIAQRTLAVDGPRSAAATSRTKRAASAAFSAAEAHLDAAGA
jgi:hypothetical protein